MFQWESLVFCVINLIILNLSGEVEIYLKSIWKRLKMKTGLFLKDIRLSNPNNYIMYDIDEKGQ